MTPALKDRLLEVIFFQRLLKMPEVGRCLYLDEKRLPKRHPLFQQRRLYETVNQLRILPAGGAGFPLTKDERDKKKVAFKTLRSLLKLDDDKRFTLYLPIPKKLSPKGLKDMVRVSDARMSGTAFGTIVLHVTPEAAAEGPLALVRNGDRIRLSVSERCIDLLVDDAELERRRAECVSLGTGSGNAARL